MRDKHNIWDLTVCEIHKRRKLWKITCPKKCMSKLCTMANRVTLKTFDVY